MAYRWSFADDSRMACRGCGAVGTWTATGESLPGGGHWLFILA
jgi:hypothetical protein